MEIPKLLSVLAFHDPNATVKGLETVGRDDRPPVNVVRVAFLTMVGIGSLLATLAAWFLWLRSRGTVDGIARSLAPLHRWLLGKYYVDEFYDAAIVQPVKMVSTGGLWKGMDAGLIDGAVNGVGLAVSGASGVLRRTQTGSVRTYAFAPFAGAVAILAYYLFI